ncbi:MAG: hypothetical protein KC619_28350, partial [Myxococcales bacterium]|nr:hypothetical protein [Myxococcales bacterium]
MTAPVRLALPPALRRDALIDHAAEHGWRLVHRAPRHLHQWLVLTWELGDGAVRYNEDPELAVRFVERTPHVGLPAEWELVDQAQALALFRGAADPVARLEALAMASALRIGPPGETLVDAWAEALASGAPELARLVLLALGRVPTEDLTGVATRLRQHASDVDRAHLDWIVERRGALERGELNDDVGGIASRDALDQMIVEARDAGRWPRVVAIANRLLELEYNETDALAWGLRAKARAELGETWPAYLDALVASELETDDEAKRGLAELAMSLEPRLEGPLPADRLEALTPISSLRRAELARVFDRMIAHADLGALDPEVRYRAAILALDEGADDAAARLEELVERLPGCREVTALFLRSTPSGEKARRAELRRQLIASFDASPHPFDARAAELLRATTIFSPVKLASLLHDELAEQQREGASPEVLIELSRRGLDADPHSPQAALDHAMMHTAAKRHADAVEAYSRCIALIGRGDSLFLLGDSEGLPWFNRACERAMCGDTEGALTDLAIAIRKNDRWREDSKGEEYFDVLRDDPRFARLLDGDL